MASNLPPEMIESILLKLPVKPLLRFKSVSKSWNTIISDPLFAKNHQFQNSKTHNLFLRKRSYYARDGLCLVKLEDGKLQTIKQLEFPGGSGECFCFSEYSVILITNYWHSERCILWNPSTRTTRKISLPYGLDTCCSGICYDPAFDDFKVVTIYRGFYAVYSCKNKSWSNRKQLPYTIDAFQRPGVSVNGAIYWILRTNRYSCEETIYYDPREDDKLTILQKPKDVRERGDFSHSYLLDLGGHLCLFAYESELDTIRIWRREKGIDNNCWKELITIRDVGMPIRTLDPLCFVGNKIVTQYRYDCDKLLIYNPLDKIFEQVEERLIGLGSLIPYGETLYTLT